LRTVAIVGSHTKAKDTAPFDQPGVDIWVFNAVAGRADTWVERYDLVFQMHQPAIYRSPHNREDPNHWKWLQKERGIPIMMLEDDPLVPDCVAYPLEEICERLLPRWYQTTGGYQAHKRYFSSTIDYAIALAIYQGYDRIELHGIEMSSNTEYAYQRVGVAFWEGIALGVGAIVVHYGGEAIFDRPLYGYEGNLEHDIIALEARYDELTKRKQEARTAVNVAEMKLDDVWQGEPKDLAQAIGALREAKQHLGYFEVARDVIERHLVKARAAAKAKRPYFIDRNEHEEQAFTAQETCDKHDRKMKESAGAVNVALQSWVNSRSPDTLNWLKKFVYQHIGHAEDLGRAHGAFKENLRLMTIADRAITAAGGEKAMELAQLEMADTELMEV